MSIGVLMQEKMLFNYLINDYATIASGAIYKLRKGKRIKILTPKQIRYNSIIY